MMTTSNTTMAREFHISPDLGNTPLILDGFIVGYRLVTEILRYEPNPNNMPASKRPRRWVSEPPTVPRQLSRRAALGEPLSFRGLQHAPINEQGVVFLFGMVCKDLGYLVEAVQSGFPDCEGKRRKTGRGNLWERVRIEFEFRSSNFLEHGHDASLCDLIVCWEHDWQDSPLEVLELRTAIQRLSSGSVPDS